MRTKDGRDVPVDKLTAENYVVPAGEELAYHAVIEVKQFDNKTGERISRPRVQKFGKKIFERSVRDSLLKQGYDIRILHDPNDHIAAEAEKKASAEKAKAEAKAKADEEKFQAAVDAAVEKKLAEQAKADQPAKKASKKAKEQE